MPFNHKQGDPDPADASQWGGHGRSERRADSSSAESKPNGSGQHESAATGNTTAAPDPLWIDDGDWIEADLPLRPWVVPGYILRGAVTLLIGPPSAMKSSLMLGWASAMAVGRNYGDDFRPREATSTIVYNVEEDATEQRKRLSAVLRQFNAQAADIRGKVIRAGPHNVGTLLTRDDQGRIHFTAAMERLETLIQERNPATLIVDPLAELHACEENDNVALRAVIAQFRELAIKYNIEVIILHHTRKGGADKPGDPDVARGASAIIGAVRVAITSTGMAETDAQNFGLPTDAKARSHYLRIDDAKQNYAPIGDARWFEKVAYILDNGEAVAAAVPWTPPAAKTATQTDLAAIATAIERGAPGGEPWSPRLSAAEPRSVRFLLEQHGFHGKDAQNKVLTRLQAECHVETARYSRGNGRHPAQGLHIRDLPAADWFGITGTVD